ncbi:unnamed protein product [Lupinus luteus]|uniref:Fe2OG dioxygenase domain-containing protein n=1 Tax=Lupinus luteus TaxID=3873 RepID=A0AAV1WD95_LUPLU
MANNLIISEEKSLPRSIQEMSIDGDEPPQQFIVNRNSIWSKDTSTNIQIPIIDLSLLLSSEAELDKLRSALSSVGCFQAIGHGMSSSYLEKVRQVAKQFFTLPVEEKQKYARPVGESEGYGSDRIVSEKQVLDWSYRLSLRVLPTEKRRLSLWPKNPSDFSDTLEEFTTKVKSMMDYLSRSMARSLNLEEDRSGITVLLQDTEVEGLQILVDDTWVNVPTIHDALVVNLGDQMQIMSNGIFKSPMHRVVTNTKKLRMSVAMFNEPEPENEIGPVEGLIDEIRPRLYRNIKNYGDINYRSYQEGKIALEMVRIEDRNETI